MRKLQKYILSLCVHPGECRINLCGLLLNTETLKLQNPFFESRAEDQVSLLKMVKAERGLHKSQKVRGENKEKERQNEQMKSQNIQAKDKILENTITRKSGRQLLSAKYCIITTGRSLLHCLWNVLKYL